MFHTQTKMWVNVNFQWHIVVRAKLLYISRTVSNSYGTEFEIWAGLWLVGSTKTAQPNLLLTDFAGSFFYVYWGKFFNIVASKLKRCIE